MPILKMGGVDFNFMTDYVDCGPQENIYNCSKTAFDCSALKSLKMTKTIQKL
jgi:hypothetical protein